MTQVFSKFVQVTGFNAAGEVVIVGTNQPIVDNYGRLIQHPLPYVLGYISDCAVSDQIADIKVEHLPLEGDYLVSCNAHHMTNLGLRYALAACYGWNDPLTGTQIVYQDGDLFVVGNADILNLAASFAPFDPWKNQALCWQIMMDFGVSIYHEERGLRCTMTPTTHTRNWICTNSHDELVRELATRAINLRHNREGSEKFTGHIPLSMVIKPDASATGIVSDEPPHCVS